MPLITTIESIHNSATTSLKKSMAAFHAFSDFHARGQRCAAQSGDAEHIGFLMV
jgi:hypothetical protein